MNEMCLQLHEATLDSSRKGPFWAQPLSVLYVPPPKGKDWIILQLFIPVPTPLFPFGHKISEAEETLDDRPQYGLSQAISSTVQPPVRSVES